MSSLHEYYLSDYSKCSKCETFLCSWQGLAYTSHAITAVLLPFHILGGYCILLKTPPQMTSYRWPLFNLHFWTCFVDILLGALMTPYLFFPALAWFTVGLLNILKVPDSVQVGLASMFVYLMAMSITILLENRHNSIPTNKFRISGNIFKALYYSIRISLGFIYSIALFSHTPEGQNAAKLQILKTIPCPTEEFFSVPNVFVLTISENFTKFLSVVSTLLYCSEIFQITFFTICCIYYLFCVECGFTSKRTRKLQIAFFRSIVLQVSIPMVFLVPTFVLLTISVAMGYYNQALTNFSVLYASIHGLLSTFAVLVLHKPYRHFIFSIFGKKAVETQKKSVSINGKLNNVTPANVVN